MSPNFASMKCQIEAKNGNISTFLQDKDFNYRLLDIFEIILRLPNITGRTCNITKFPFTE